MLVMLVMLVMLFLQDEEYKISKKIFNLKNVVILVILRFLKILLEEKYFYNIYCTVPPECSNVSNVRNVVVSKRKIFFSWTIKSLL